MKKSIPIPLYKLQERSEAPIEIRKLEFSHLSSHPAHRDDSYALFFQECGTTKVMVDFQEVVIKDSAVFCILPGQVHYGICIEGTVAWIIAVDPTWINDAFRSILMEGNIRSTAVPLDSDESILLTDSIQLLNRLDVPLSGSFDAQAKRSMFDVCLSLFVKGYHKQIASSSSSNLRIAIINKQFRSLLMVNYRIMKSPSEYASALNISPSYLNEAVKESSGHPVSYWIHQEVIMEAKRMLYYSESSVKEIAYDLGYADPTYFIRLFTKVAGLPPIQFRQKHRK